MSYEAILKMLCTHLGTPSVDFIADDKEHMLIWENLPGCQNVTLSEGLQDEGMPMVLFSGHGEASDSDVWKPSEGAEDLLCILDRRGL